MINIVIPMAGAGSRFARAGFELPKPLIDVRGRPMIEVVVDNLRPVREHRFVFICQRAHVDNFELRKRLSTIAPGSCIVCVDGLTEGAACTVLAARDLIADDTPLMIANSDQYVDTNIEGYLAASDARGLDGLIMTMEADDPKWSFVRLDERDLVGEVAEKRVISTHATVGIYNFARGTDFVSGAEAMIFRNDRVNNEFYVAPVYNYLIGRGKRIGYFDVGPLAKVMHGLGTPEDLRTFLNANVI